MGRRYDHVWTGIVTAIAVAETCALRSGDQSNTATHYLRRLTHVSSPVGKGLVIGGCAWLALHLLRQVEGAVTK